MERVGSGVWSPKIAAEEDAFLLILGKGTFWAAAPTIWVLDVWYVDVYSTSSIPGRHDVWFFELVRWRREKVGGERGANQNV